jgi:hypothetical protein
MKGVSLNFGSIKDTILRHSSKTIISEGKAVSLVEMFTNHVKDNPLLKIQYLIFKNIENGHFSKDYLAERYLNQNIGMVSSFDFEEILSTNKDFRFKILNNTHVQSSPSNVKLYESIHTLIKAKTSKGYNLFDEENQAYESLINHLTRPQEALGALNESKEEELEIPSLLSWKYVTEVAVNNFNQRYAHLNEDEQVLVKILTSDEGYKKNYLEDLKEENLTAIESLIATSKDEEMVADLNRFKSKILSLKEDSNIDESIINLYELKSNLQ